MSTAKVIFDWYKTHESEEALSRVIYRCFFFGVIINRPGFLLMAEPCFVVPDGGEPKLLFHGFDGANGWYLHFWTSEHAMTSYELCLEAPYPLPWVVFKRRGKIKVLPWELLYNKDFYVGKRPLKEPRHAVPC